MAVRRSTRPVKPPAGAARADVKADANKTTARKTAKTLASKTSTSKTSANKTLTNKIWTKATTAKAVAARKETIARTGKLVDQTLLKTDDGDEIANARIAALRAAKARPADHRGRLKRSAAERAGDPPAATGEALIERVSRAIERELTQIEVIVGGHHVGPRQRSEAERRARTLASLARTLREVTALRLSGKKEKREDDDAVPRDIGELRLALARRLDQLVADAKTAHLEGSE